jgi:hypothetical protein
MKKLSLWLLLPLLVLAGCNRDEPVIGSSSQQVIYPDPNVGEIKGFFLLNEGNMGSNKASLDYFDYATGVYTRNIFAERNPGVVKELGDVGNDLQIYRERLYAVINCSHLVEVMDARTAKHIGTVSIPNCRYIVFKDNYAYVSSYAGPVQIDPNARLGYVAKIDLETLKVVGECTVGYQPEEMAIAGNKLYVANSGGYLIDKYDRTVSVIDLGSFTETKKIDVAINLHRVELDRYGNLWVSSRGDHHNVPSKTFVIDTASDTVTHSFDLPNNNMTRSGDNLFIYSSGWSEITQSHTMSYAVVDTSTKQITSRQVITDGTDSKMKIPYGLAVNRENGEIIVTDAKDYVTPGTVYCFRPDGTLKWSKGTGDIPAHIAFTTTALLPPGNEPDPQPSGPSAYITQVLDFMPAVGQFTNKMPLCDATDTPETMRQLALDIVGNNNKGLISLGGWGGYIVVGFDHTIANVAGRRDFRVLGNAAEGSSEPGVITVAHDANKNGKPDPDEWFEIAGSAHRNPSSEPWLAAATAAGNDTRLIRDYEITYHRPAPDSNTVGWEDNQGNSGIIAKNEFHSQSYYPLFAGEKITFRGTRLPQNAIDQRQPGAADPYFVLNNFAFGYADNAFNTSTGTTIDIDWAVDANNQPVTLPGVDFIKVHTGVRQINGWIGECSTEFMGIEDLHILGIEIDS